MTTTNTNDSPLAPEAVTELRHELRTPVNLIVGYCEMLLEDATGPAHARRREALEEALGAVREVLAQINSALPAARAEVRPSDVTALYESLRLPQAKIMQAMSALLIPQESAPDEEFSSDVRKIRHSAERLLAIDLPGLTTSGPAPPAPEPVDLGAEPDAADVEPVDEAAARILVVDDIEDNRNVLERRLRREGHIVECAEHGRMALEMVAQRRFDVVLLDIMMPEIDGYEVLERLKGAPATRDIPVIMISALDDVDSVVKCIERGAEDHLPKPFEPVLLRARINACLEKKRLRDREKAYLAQVKQVADAASNVESGTYRSGSLSDVAGRADELGRLARVFDAMAGEVRAREERLRKQVSDLRREIGEAKPKVRTSDAVEDTPALTTGELFADRYEILEEIGKGGMGTVYRAHDIELDDNVAIKTLRPDLMRGDPSMIDRFKSEIRLARRISHRNVVRTHDLGEWQDFYYLTMEYVEGITVRELVDTRGQLGVSSSIAIGTQLSRALEVAHEEGIIHRDVKPQNLLLDEDGVLKVMDFGIARLAERTSPLTEAGLIVGTPAYMSPEQLLGDEIDPRSDLYAAGVVLYECLTGGPPFKANSPISLVAKMLQEEPSPPATLNADIPPALSALVMTLLSRKPEDRPPSAQDLAERLSQIA